jgi:hypothetical protein
VEESDEGCVVHWPTDGSRRGIPETLDSTCYRGYEVIDILDILDILDNNRCNRTAQVSGILELADFLLFPCLCQEH